MDEFGLIEAVRERLARAGAPQRVPGLILGSGDDAAISRRSAPVVTSVDALVEGVHFRMPPFAYEDVGAKALAVALSDVAAMGATAREAYVQLGLPPSHDDGALAIADGLGAVAAEFEVAVAGGDVTRSGDLFCAVTVIGEVEAGEPVRRDGAGPGDVLAITGELGGAAAGLLALERPELAEALDAETADALRARQLRPRPRLAAGRRLAAIGTTAMIDVSDGLGGDARHLARSLEIEVDRVPVQAGVAEVAGAAGRAPTALALGGGEDYELLVALPAARFDEAVAELGGLGVRLTEVGRIDESTGGAAEVVFRDAGGARVEVSGYDQLR